MIKKVEKSEALVTNRKFVPCEAESTEIHLFSKDIFNQCNGEV